ncbi:unnamed protein product [Bursaphelenchus okinawaensis]|uniref:Uncharacterized protein n=1 Tax=Bursaphelenchus okinawaensis TaxID=465554 RepID=A0A811JUU2_9BILA|nr:unnamed protein product [Bursaphelenchus okinawaensis]CAG9084650.1 unnamed protein product [Bursaphelenchus okinawaensis]
MPVQSRPNKVRGGTGRKVEWAAQVDRQDSGDGRGQGLCKAHSAHGPGQVGMMDTFRVRNYHESGRAEGGGEVERIVGASTTCR